MILEADLHVRQKLIPMFEKIDSTIILSCLQGHMGTAWVDDLENPTVAQITVGIFVFFAGNADTKAAEELLHNLPDFTLAIVDSDEWKNRIETVHVEPRPVIIVEGIMTLINKRLRDMMDIKIFVDTDADERLIRNIIRDTKERGRNAEMVMDRYRKVLKPMHDQFIEPTKRFADIIIPDGGSTQGIDMVCKYIQQTVADEVLGETKKEE